MLPRRGDGAADASCKLAIARASARAVGRVAIASPHRSPARVSRAGMVLTVNASIRRRLVSSRGRSGADTDAAGRALTLYGAAMLLPRAFCNAST